MPRLIVAPLALAFAVSSAAAQVSLPPFLEVRVPKPPTVTHGGGQAILPYELHVTNLTGRPLTLQRIEVLNAESGAPLATLSDSALARAIARVGVRVPATEAAHVGPGLRAVIYLWIPLTGPVPRAVRHRLTAVADSGDTAPMVLETPAVTVTNDVLVIGPPLRGGVWLAALAVADGAVSAVKDSIPQNVPGATSRAVPITLETVGGNHVIVDIGGGHFAFYAHLQPGSIKVHVGDRVRRGQLLGLVGNSGNSTEPHLHFHISDASSPLGSEGIPYVFDTLEIVGRCRTFNVDCVRTAPITEHREMPMANELVRFR